MNVVVFLKQVPDVTNIPPEAWDLEKGTLKRGLLDNVLNALDLHALTLAHELHRSLSPDQGKLVCVTMGPPSAGEVLLDALSRGADEGVLLTDMAFAGADTIATASVLAAAVRRIETELFAGQRDYLVVAGMQSVDGDTAQVPAQVAEALGIDLVAYATGLADPKKLHLRRIGPTGIETVSIRQLPALVTVTDCTDPLYPSFHNARAAHLRPLPYQTWNAKDLDAPPTAIGAKGSRTQAVKIFSPKTHGQKQCQMVDDADQLVARIAADLQSAGAKEAAPQQAPYQLEEGQGQYHGEIWTFAHTQDDAVAPVTLELLAKARELAAVLNEPVGCVLVGHNVTHLAADLIAHGADKVYLADRAELDRFLSTPCKSVVSAMVNQVRPQIVLFGATPLGRELAPRVAYATQSGLTADCTHLEIGDHASAKGILLQTRPALGGNIMATIVTRNSQTQMATVRPGVFKATAPDANRKGEVINYSGPVAAGTIDILSIEPAAAKVDLHAVEIIVAGGAGLRSSENYQKFVTPLASALSGRFNRPAQVGASRRAVDNGVVSRDYQIGQTGQTVEPSLYFAIGISGAVQHVSGIGKSKIIVAINSDPNAPIFRLADLGMVGKAEQIVPKLIAALEK